MNLHTGEPQWEQVIDGDVITAPVVEGDEVFCSCLNGTSYCLKAATGEIIWRHENEGTSAPLVVGGRVVFAEKEKRADGVYQRVRRKHRGTGVNSDPESMYVRAAQYLSVEKSGGSPIKETQAGQLDGQVGFVSAPSSAKLDEAAAHLGVGRVSGAWAYQGSRAAYARGRLFNTHGPCISCHLDEEQALDWEATVKGRHVDLDDQVFLPAAVGRRKPVPEYDAGPRAVRRAGLRQTLVSSMTCDVRSASNHASRNGRMYFGTLNGELICLDTGSDDADGWHMWGGNAQHNRVVEE